MSDDDEIEAMRAAYAAFASITPEGQKRALAWLERRLNMEWARGELVGSCVASIAFRSTRQNPRRVA
jgi:hypothetical protein